MRKTAVIWKESIYKNGFRCNECGAQLTNQEFGFPEKESLKASLDGEMFCARCGNFVARMQTVEAEPWRMGLQGSWDEYKKQRGIL